MTTFTENNLPVQPFVIAPIALIEREAAFILQPRELDPNNRLIQRLYVGINKNNMRCPLILQAFPYKGKVLVSCTIQTNVRDDFSGRLGAKLTYGALISKKMFLYHPNVCSKTFEILDEYLQKEFNVESNLTGADKIISRLQQTDQSLDNLISPTKKSELFQRLECEFWLAESNFVHRITSNFKLLFIKLKLLQYHNVTPVTSWDKTRGVWENIDHYLSFIRKTDFRLFLHRLTIFLFFVLIFMPINFVVIVSIPQNTPLQILAVLYSIAMAVIAVVIFRKIEQLFSTSKQTKLVLHSHTDNVYLTKVVLLALFTLITMSFIMISQLLLISLQISIK